VNTLRKGDGDDDDDDDMQREAEKKLKYKSLCIEILRIWDMQCVIICVVIEAAGIVTEGLKQNV
jgi:hypothetical protein